MPQNAHGAAKGGVLALTYQLVVEGGPHGIRVNAVSPAMTETPHTAPLLRDPEGPGASIAARVPLGRWGQPEDVAQAPRVMWHDTWTFGLDDAVELLTWLHGALPGLDRRVEPVVAATRLPGVPLHDGTARPDGTVLLLHTTVMADSDTHARALLAAFGDGPLAGRALGHVQGRTSVLEENAAQTAQNPADYRYAVDCTWSDAPARVLAPLLHELWSELDTEHSFSIWYGWAPQRNLPDMAFSVEADVYVATYAIYTDPADDARYQDWVHRRTAALAVHGTGVYLGDTDFTRRQDRFLSDDAYRRLAAIRAERDPSGRFASYLTSDPAGLNAHG